MKFFHWRNSETSTSEQLHSFTGLDTDVDKTPVAMFRQISGKHVGLSMPEIGELVEHHNQLLQWGDPPTEMRKALEHETRLARDGADAIAIQFNEFLDDRLREPKPLQESSPKAVSEYTNLMQRMKTSNLKRS